MKEIWNHENDKNCLNGTVSVLKFKLIKIQMRTNSVGDELWVCVMWDPIKKTLVSNIGHIQL